MMEAQVEKDLVFAAHDGTELALDIYRAPHDDAPVTPTALRRLAPRATFTKELCTWTSPSRSAGISVACPFEPEAPDGIRSAARARQAKVTGEPTTVQGHR